MINPIYTLFRIQELRVQRVSYSLTLTLGMSYSLTYVSRVRVLAFDGSGSG